MLVSRDCCGWRGPKMGALEKNKIKYSLWICFIVLTASNSLLSFANLSFLLEGWIFVVGIIFPVCFWIFGRDLILGKFEMDFSGNSKGFLSAVPPRFSIWMVFFFSIILRAYFYLSSNRWPGGDEALNGFLAIDLARKWRWDFFYTCGQLPPLLTWGMSLLFKVSDSYRLGLWLIPLLVSSLTVLVAYWAFRFLLNDNLSFLSGCLVSFSFWPVYQEGFCHQGIFIPLWEIFLLFIFGFYLRNSHKGKKKWLVLALGLTTGMGSFTFTSWPVVAVGVLLAFFFALESPLKPNFRQKLIFLAGFFLATTPFCFAIFKNGYGAHILGSSSLTQWYGSAHQWMTRMDYLSTIFWGSFQGGTSYGPVWGGMLNPLLSSFFWVGAAEVLRHRKTALWFGLSLALALLPGLLSADYVEMFRIIQVMPLVLLVAAIGFQPLLLTFREKQRAAFLVLFLCGSFGLDFHHLSLAFSSFEMEKSEKSMKISSNENFNAFQILEKTNRSKGPGLIFTDFLPLSYGHLLGVTTYSFNALTNTRISYSSATWSGIVTNYNYQPFLADEFPKAQWYWAGKDFDSLGGGLMVGIIPLNGENQALFGHLARAHKFFHQLSVESEIDFYNKAVYQQSIQNLDSGYPLVENDRFLESCYGEWVAQYFFGPSYSENIAALQRAIQKGYPAAHLYQRLSDILAGQGRPAESEKAHIKALQAAPHFQLKPDLEKEDLHLSGDDRKAPILAPKKSSWKQGKE